MTWRTLKNENMGFDIFFFKCTYFFDRCFWKEKKIVNCVSRQNTNFSVNKEISNRVHCKKICNFIFFLKCSFFFGRYLLKKKKKLLTLWVGKKTFGVKIKKYDSAHCKKWNYVILYYFWKCTYFFEWYLWKKKTLLTVWETKTQTLLQR
jgi:hypothetical protein